MGDTYFLRVSTTSRSILSFASAGNFSWFALMSSSTALFMDSRNLATSSSAKLSRTSAEEGDFFLRGREGFFERRISSIFMSRRILFAKKDITVRLGREAGGKGRPCSGGNSLKSTSTGCFLFLFLATLACSPSWGLLRVTFFLVAFPTTIPAGVFCWT